MFIQNHGRSDRSKLVLLTDHRSKYDHDCSRELKATHVLDHYPIGRAALPRTYRGTTRISLFDYDQTPTTKERHAARKSLEDFLATVKPRVTVVLPNEKNTADKLGPTLCWRVFNAPDAIEEMRGTFHKYAPGSYAVAAHSRSKRLKQVQLWQQARFLRRALDVAQRRVEVLMCEWKHTHISEAMVMLLRRLRESSLAVDIESIESTDTITAIGISDGETAVSLAYDSFMPAGRSDVEPGYRTLPFGKECHRLLHECLANDRAKIFHNYTFDVPRLRREGFTINGPIHDTFAAHSIAFPELRHGLQHAVSDMVPCGPWKSAWHPKLPGIDRDDEEYWSCDPEALRDYNADDAFHTFHLARAVLPCVGVDL